MKATAFKRIPPVSSTATAMPRAGKPRAMRNRYDMAAKERVPPPQPVPNRAWPQLSKAEQNTAYTAALLAYSRGTGPNPQTGADYARAQSSAANATAGKP